MVQHDSDQSGAEQGDERDSGSVARMIRLISGDFLLTVNPVDGSEIEPCPPAQRPGRPMKRPAGPRSALVGPAEGETVPPEAPLLERDEERDRLARLLGHGRSVRLTGPRGAGRSTLLDAVAADIDTPAPDGVVRLSGYRRTVADILNDLFAAVYDAPGLRPDSTRLREALAQVGAVVILDDVEFGGAALDELLAATPECAFLISTTPDVAAPSAPSHLEEVFLSGLSRTGCVDLLEQIVRRQLTDAEADWAADLWFETEGRPLDFVQAGALLRQRSAGAHAGTALPARTDTIALLASGLTEHARNLLRFAVALGGELPHRSQLPALLGEPDGDVVAELAAAGLITTAGGHHRLPAEVASQLADAGYEVGADGRVDSAARHYAWWAGQISVTPERVADEADVMLAALAAAQRGPHAEAGVLLARTAAPILAAGLRWGAWERLLRGGQEAARLAGEVAEEAYFHHELGVLALCAGNLERARAELEASIGLRGVLADRRGAVAGRRALALVTDRLAAATAPVPGVTGPVSSTGPTAALDVVSAPGAAAAPSASAASASAPGPGRADTPPMPSPNLVKRPAEVPAPPEIPTTVSTAAGEVSAAALGTAAEMDESIATLTARGPGGLGPDSDGGSRRRLALLGTRKNVVAAGAGAVLAAVLGTVVTLGSVSDDGEDPSEPVQPDHSTSQPDDYSDLPSATPSRDDDERPSPAPSPVSPGATSEAPSPTESAPSASPSDDPSSPSDAPSSPGSTGGSSGGGEHTDEPTEDPTPTPTKEPTQTPPTSPEPTEPSSEGAQGGDTAGPSTTASGPAPTSTANESGEVFSGSSGGGADAPVA